jgi:hypothetical protein
MSSLLEGERCLKSEVSSLLVENVQMFSRIPVVESCL